MRSTPLLPLVLATLATAGCYLSHARPSDAAASDAGSVPDTRAADASGDGGCALVETLLADDVDRVVRARQGSLSYLAVSFFRPRRPDANVEVWSVQFPSGGADHRPTTALRFRIPDSANAQPVAAALDHQRLALALDYGERPDELLVIRISDGAILARGVLDETLTSGFVSYAWLALDGTRVLSVVAFPEGGSRVRVRDVDPSGGGTFGVAFDASRPEMESPRTAAVVGSASAVVRDVLDATIGGDAQRTLRALPTNPLVDLDGTSVLALPFPSVQIDGRERGVTDRTWSSFYGTPTLAVGVRTVVAVSTGSGLFWDVIDGTDRIAWRAASTAFLAGAPVAHVDAENAGIFFLTPAFGADTSHLRWVGEHCAR